MKTSKTTSNIYTLRLDTHQFKANQVDPNNNRVGFAQGGAVEMDVRDWIIVAATLLGPILAVQAQKAVEAFRERRNHKNWVFGQLMATRAARVSPDHVRALNMIDLVFYGNRVLGILRRTKGEQGVLDAWKEYLDHLNTKVDEESFALWASRGDELFTNLLFAIASDLDFQFDRVQLKKGAYSPIAHEDLENEQRALRRVALEVLAGETPIKMNVVGFPINEDAAESHRETIRRLGEVIQDGALKVEVQ